MASHRKKDPGITELPHIHSIGISIWDPVWAEKEHVSAHSEFMHILEGQVILRVNGKKYKGKKGDILHIPKATLHRDEFPSGSEFKVLHIQFEWKNVNANFPDDCNRALLKLSESDKQTINETALSIFRTFQEDRPLAQEIIRAKFLTLLLCAASAILNKPIIKKNQQSEKRSALVEEAKGFIKDNINKPVTLKSIAKHLKLSEYYLSHLFSELTGFTLWSYITHLRMVKAGELLQDPTLRVSEAAYEVGYENPNYFTKAFKKHHGVSPSAFRSRK